MSRVALAALAALLLAGGAGAQAPSVPPFRHVIVIVFENKERSSVLGSSNAPAFNELADRYASLSDYRGVTHPSLPNYLALVSGSTHGIRHNCTACVVRGTSLADTLERAGKTWRTYAEGLPRAGFRGAFSGRYAKKHNPFLYFPAVASSAKRRAHVVPLTRFAGDLRHRALPDFALVVPDLCHSMHDCSVETGDRWLGEFVTPLLASPELKGSVVFVVFDEGTSEIGGGGEISALALGPAVRPGARYAPALNHYGLLRTIEDAWRLPALGASKGARPITGIWR